MFEKESSDEADKVFILMTDGNPNVPNGGNTDVCAWSSTLKTNDINTYIVGIGESLDVETVDCLVEDPDSDIFSVTAFNYSDFDKILPELSDITCPGMCCTVCNS